MSHSLSPLTEVSLRCTSLLSLHYRGGAEEEGVQLVPQRTSAGVHHWHPQHPRGGVSLTITISLSLGGRDGEREWRYLIRL